MGRVVGEQDGNGIGVIENERQSSDFALQSE